MVGNFRERVIPSFKNVKTMMEKVCILAILFNTLNSLAFADVTSALLISQW